MQTRRLISVFLFFFPSGNFERFFFIFFEKKQEGEKTPQGEEEEEKGRVSNINALLRKRVFSFN